MKQAVQHPYGRLAENYKGADISALGVPDAGRAKALALVQRLEDTPVRQPHNGSGPGRQILEKLLLALDLQRRDDAFRTKQICNLHDSPIAENQALKTLSLQPPVCITTP